MLKRAETARVVISANENTEATAPPVATECPNQPEIKTNEVAEATETADAIQEFVNEISADVDNETHPDVINKLQLDVIKKPSIATKPSEISLSFEDNEGSGELHEESGKSEQDTTVSSESDLLAKSVAKETPTQVTDDVVGNDVCPDENDPVSANENESDQLSTNENGPEEVSTSESDTGRDDETERQERNKVARNSDSDESSEDIDGSASFIDLIPMLDAHPSEAVQVAVIARVPADDPHGEDSTPAEDTNPPTTQTSNNVVESNHPATEDRHDVGESETRTD